MRQSLNLFSLFCLVVPPELRNLTAVERRKREISIQWRPPLYHHYYNIKSYTVDVRTFGDSFKESYDVGIAVDSYVFRGLKPGTSYTIRARALNHIGPGITSELEIETLSGIE